MNEVSVPASAFGFALGIADADGIGTSAKLQAATPINRNRFIMGHPSDRVYRDD